MPWKDKSKPKIKCRKITMLEERWDMFDKAKAKSEREYGFMSNGGFLEQILINYLQDEQNKDELKRSEKRLNKNNKLK
jgi:hypothetical protein